MAMSAIHHPNALLDLPFSSDAPNRSAAVGDNVVGVWVGGKVVGAEDVDAATVAAVDVITVDGTAVVAKNIGVAVVVCAGVVGAMVGPTVGDVEKRGVGLGVVGANAGRAVGGAVVGCTDVGCAVVGAAEVGANVTGALPGVVGASVVGAYVGCTVGIVVGMAVGLVVGVDGDMLCTTGLLVDVGEEDVGEVEGVAVG